MLMQDVRALLALVEEERVRVARSLGLVRTLEGGALLMLSESRHAALQDIDTRARKVAVSLKAAPFPRPGPLAELLEGLRGAVDSLRQENHALMGLLQQALSLLGAYRAALPGAPATYNRRGQRPAGAEPRVRHSSRA